MAERKSKIARVTQYFRDADTDEMRVVFTIVREIVEARLHTGAKIAPKPPLARRARARRPPAIPPAPMTKAAAAAGESLADA